MTNEQYGYPYIALSRLRKYKKLAIYDEEHVGWYDIWLWRVRQEIDRLIIEDLQNDIRNARNYRGVEGYACPLCTYRNGVWIKNCSMHQQIENLTSELEKYKAIVEMYEQTDPDQKDPGYIGSVDWEAPSGRVWKIDFHQGDEDE